MRILHTADWHLGRVLHDHPLLDDQEIFLDWFLDQCEDLHPDLVLLAGDVFDRSIPPEEAVRTWTRFLENFRRRFPVLPLGLLAGNHDSPSRLGFAAGLLKAAGVHVAGQLTGTPEFFDLTDPQGTKARVWLVPFLWPGALEVLTPEGAVPTSTQEESLKAALDQIRAQGLAPGLNILAAHCFTAGGRNSDSERTLVGTATLVDPQVFQGFDYTALGHLHRCQQVTPRVWYSGSPLSYSFSEVDQEKALLVVDVSHSEGPQVQKIPVPAPRKMGILRGAVGDLLTNPRYKDWEDWYLRIEVEDENGIAHPRERLLARFPGLLNYQVLDLSLFPGDRLDEGPAAPSRKEDLPEDFREFHRALTGAPPDPALEACFLSVAARVGEPE